jgi:hypothetical protein
MFSRDTPALDRQSRAPMESPRAWRWLRSAVSPPACAPTFRPNLRRGIKPHRRVIER